MLGLSYFEKVVELQKKYQPVGIKISNDLQTNGTLLDDKWCEFLAKNQFLVGLSIDGHRCYTMLTEPTEQGVVHISKS